MVAWAGIRTIIVWAALHEYGINPWIYLSLDLASAITDAVTTPRMVLDFIDDRFKQAVIWALVSFVAFIIPDLYIFLGTRTLPKSIILALCFIILITLAVGVIAVVRKVGQGRAQRLLAE